MSRCSIRVLFFCIIGAAFPHNKVTARVMPTIYHWDLRSTQSLPANQRYDMRHTAVCIQGLVNREAPRLFLNFHDGMPSMAGDTLWLNRLQEPNGLCENWPVHNISGIGETIQLFSRYLNGVVLYDPDPTTGVISTSLVATTVAGVEGAIAVRKDTTAGSMYNYLVNDVSGPQFPVLIDLTGKFTGLGTIWQTSTPSTGSAKCDAYIWAKEKYIDTGRSDPTVLSYTLDLWGLKINADLKSQLSNLDYPVSRKGFCFELSPWGDEVPNDDPTQPLGADLDTFRKILAACNVQTGQSKMIGLSGFLNWPFKYNNSGGIGSIHPVHLSEAEWVLLVTSYNVYYEAEAEGPQYISNASFYAGLKPEITSRRYVQNPPPTYADMVSRGLINGSGNVVPGNYILLGMGEYDNAAWSLYLGAGDRYDGPVRGQIYCSWGINPINIERASVAVDYMYRHKTPKDYFMAWESGAAVAVPTNMHGTRSHSTYPSIVSVWQNLCREYYRLLDYSISGWLLDGNATAGHLTTTDVQNYASFSGDGVGLAINSPAMNHTTLVNNVPAIKRSPPDIFGFTPTFSDLNMNSTSGVNFGFYRSIFMYPWQVKALEDDAAASAGNNRLLDAFTFYYLLRYSQGGNNNYRATWVSDTIPRIMAAGQTYPVTITVRNDGWDTWSESGQYRLGYAILPPGSATAISSDYDVNGRINLPAGTTVNPGEIAIFSFAITAPSTNGGYDLYYDMVQDGVTWFHGQNNIEWKKEIIVATNETDVDTDGDGFSDVGEQACGTLYWHPDDDATCCASPLADLNGNCRVDIEDHAVLAQEWLSNGFNLSFPVGTVWDLKNNWSDTSNPTGPWSYRGTNESLFNVHTVPYSPGDFDPSQPGWKSVMYPFWVGMAKMIINGSGAPAGRKFDYLAGDVLGHANWKVRWTSPDAMTVRVSGDVWRIRNSDVLHASLSENGAQGLHDIGDILAANGRNNRITYNYTFGVVPGQVVTLFMSGNDYGAVNMTVAVVDNCTKPVSSDLDNDCDVDVADLLILVQDWLGCGLFYQTNCFVN